MADPVALLQLVDLPPADAIRYLDSKGYQFGTNWQDVWQDEHVAAFTAAKVARLDILRTLHVSLLDAMARGQTFQAWQAELEPALRAQGWWGTVTDAEITGTSQPVTIGPRRLRVIYDTNLRMARATALWGRIQANKARLPYLRYSAVLDRRTRPEHRAWHGTILPVDHPFWRSHFPPNGWNCRCTVVQLDDAQLARRGWQVSAEPPPAPLVDYFRRGSRDRAPAVVQVPQGIDPGFAYNPGTSRARMMMDKAAQSLADASSVPGAIEAALPDLLAGLPAGPQPQAVIDQMIAQARAGQVVELAAALAQLLGVVATAATIGGWEEMPVAPDALPDGMAALEQLVPIERALLQWLDKNGGKGHRSRFVPALVDDDAKLAQGMAKNTALQLAAVAGRWCKRLIESDLMAERRDANDQYEAHVLTGAGRELARAVADQEAARLSA